MGHWYGEVNSREKDHDLQYPKVFSLFGVWRKEKHSTALRTTLQGFLIWTSY